MDNPFTDLPWIYWFTVENCNPRRVSLLVQKGLLPESTAQKGLALYELSLRTYLMLAE